MIGTVLKGRYKLVKNLKRGAFGRIYLAEICEAAGEEPALEQPAGKQWCIVRHFQPNLAEPSILKEARWRFETEVQRLEALENCPDVAHICDAFEHDEQFYTVEDYIEGHDLGEEIGEGRRWNDRQAINLLYDVLKILECVHGYDIVHRNIKPSNLIRRRQEGGIAAIDFGSLKEIETLAIAAQGQVTTAAIGTPGYMSVEQLGGKPTASSDLYALGMTAIQALTGMSPRQLQRHPQTGLLMWRPLVEVDARLADILDRMVHTDLNERYQRAKDVLEDLKNLHRIGEVVDNRYQILRELGEGQLDRTWLAKDLQRTGQSYCILKQLKIDNHEAFPLWEARNLFDTEAQILHGLGTHDRIPQLLADFEANGQLYLVREYVEGESLQDKLAAGGRFDEGQTIAFLKDVLETLKFVHEQNTIHQDLKPSSAIVRGSDGKIALTDFGSVKQISTLTIEGGQLKSVGVVGTPGYMPKEQQVGNPRPNSDIYAVGAIAIHLLTGIHPTHLGRDPETGELSWRQHATVTEGLARILDKMVLSYFRDRYGSASEVLADLALLDPNRSEAPEKAIAPSPTPTDPPRDRQRPRNRSSATGLTPSPQWMWGVLVAAAVAVVAALVSLVVQMQQARSQMQQADGFVDRANELLAAEEPNAANEECYKALAVAADYARSWQCSGDTFYTLGRHELAAIAYQKALDLDPDTARLWGDRAKVLAELERPAEALVAYDRALQLDPTLLSARSGRGRALLALERYEEALEQFQTVAEQEPNNLEAWERQAEALDALNRPEDARQAYEGALQAYASAIAREPDNPELWAGQGRILGQLDRLDEALDSVDRALELNPNSASIWQKQGGLLVRLQRFYDARDAFDRAIELDPNSAAAWYDLASLLSTGLLRYDSGVAAYDRAIELQPEFAAAWRDRGIAQTLLGRYQAALDSFDRALEIDPQDYKTWARRGVVFNELRRYDEAIESFDRAVELETDDAFVWVSRGIALESLERYEEALDSYERAIALDPDYQLALDYRRSVRDLLGRY